MEGIATMAMPFFRKISGKGAVVMKQQKKKMSLAMQIFIALILAILVGLLIQSHADFANSYIKPFGTIFLNLVKFIVVPIVLFSIMCGIISMSDIR